MNLILLLLSLGSSDLSLDTRWRLDLWSHGIQRQPRVAVNNNGDVCVIEYKGVRVAIFNREGQVVSRFGSFGRSKDQFLALHTVTVMPNTNLFVLYDQSRAALTLVDGQGVSQEFIVLRRDISNPFLVDPTQFLAQFNERHEGTSKQQLYLGQTEGDQQRLLFEHEGDPRKGGMLTAPGPALVVCLAPGGRELKLVPYQGEPTTITVGPELTDHESNYTSTIVSNGRKKTVKESFTSVVSRMDQDEKGRIWVFGHPKTNTTLYPFVVYNRKGVRLGDGILEDFPKAVTSWHLYFLEDPSFGKMTLKKVAYTLKP